MFASFLIWYYYYNILLSICQYLFEKNIDQFRRLTSKYPGLRYRKTLSLMPTAGVLSSGFKGIAPFAAGLALGPTCQPACSRPRPSRPDLCSDGSNPPLPPWASRILVGQSRCLPHPYTHIIPQKNGFVNTFLPFF